jgi:hypothetical protein
MKKDKPNTLKILLLEAWKLICKKIADQKRFTILQATVACTFFFGLGLLLGALVF